MAEIDIGTLLLTVGWPATENVADREYIPAGRSAGSGCGGGRAGFGTVNWIDTSEEPAVAGSVWLMPRRALVSSTVLGLASAAPETVTVSPSCAAGCPLGGITAVSVGRPVPSPGWALM